VKARFNGDRLKADDALEPPAAPETDYETVRLNRAASLTSQVPYPQRFELARKYVNEGPSLPDDAAPGDRILIEVLSQQATIGPCNLPRPGLWDSAETRARHEAWTKLGAMTKQEAMHLYVQALEIFRKDWVLWKGLGVAGGDAPGTGSAPPPQPRPPPPAPPTESAADPANGTAIQTQAAGPAKAKAPPTEQLYLLDISPSSRSVGVLLALLPKASQVEVHMVQNTRDLPESVHKGRAKLPLLVDPRTGFELWDAHAIMGYLSDKYGSQAVPPVDFCFPLEIGLKAKVNQFLAYRQATLWPAVRDHVFAQLFPSSPVCPVSRGPALREYVDNSERRLRMELNRLNTVFLDTTPFLVGASPSAADITCACAISLLDWVSSPRIDNYPNVDAWFRAVKNLPGYKAQSAAHSSFASTSNSVQQGHFALALIE